MWIKILVTWLFEAQNLNPRPVQTLTVELTHLEIKAPILISQSQEGLLVRVKLVLTFPNRSQYSSERIWKINSFIFYVKSPRIQLRFKLVRNNGDVRRLVLKKSVVVEKNNSILLLYSLHIQGTIFDSANYAESLWKASISNIFCHLLRFQSSIRFPSFSARSPKMGNFLRLRHVKKLLVYTRYAPRSEMYLSYLIIYSPLSKRFRASSSRKLGGELKII